MGYLHEATESPHATATRSQEAICLNRAHISADGEPLVAPIAQSTTFCRSGVGSNPTHQYSRVSNPSVLALETTLGRLENTPPAVCFGTGLAAETALFLSLLQAGDHVVCGRSVYGGTTRLLQQLLSGLGIATTFVDSTNPDEVQLAIRPNTKLLFIETPATRPRSPSSAPMPRPPSAPACSCAAAKRSSSTTLPPSAWRRVFPWLSRR